jgi:hemerythrin-like domain-containing protein
MLRDRNLIPLSHQHQHALALCVRIERGLRPGGPDLRVWQEEIATLFESEIRFHFEAEERVLFPAAARQAGLRDLVDQLRIEHGSLRRYAQSAAASTMSMAELQVFAASLASHIRKEERELFEGMQQSFSPEELSALGEQLDAYFSASGMPGASCALRPRA